jgi:N-acyl-D-aspartate/D-glutamate deacylase
VLTLEEAVRRMTSLPASRFGFKDRGVIAVGKKADLVVFDPKTIKDHATPSQPGALSTGVSTVVVNGELVLDGGKVQSARPGRILKRS